VSISIKHHCFVHGRVVTLAAAPAHRSAWAKSHKILEFCPRFALEVLGRCAPSTYCLVWVLRYDILSSGDSLKVLMAYLGMTRL